VQTVAPHTLRGLEHALLLPFACSFHSNTAGHSRAPASTSTSTSASASPARAGRSIAPSAQIEESLYPEAGLLAYDIGVVCRWYEADGLGSACVEIAGGMYALLHGVGGEGAFVIHDDVVRRADGALEARVRLQVEVKVYQGRHAAIDDGTRARVPVPVREVRVRRVEARVVPLAADEDAQVRVVLWVLGIDPLERLEDLRQLFVYHLIVLALWWVARGVG
jgi:hypothetical protein